MSPNARLFMKLETWIGEIYVSPTFVSYKIKLIGIVSISLVDHH